MQVRAPGLVVMKMMVEGLGRSPEPFPFPAHMAGLFLGHVRPEALCSGGAAGSGGSCSRQERLGGLGRGCGLRLSSSTGLVAPSWFAAQLGCFPGGLHRVLHHKVEQALLALQELNEQENNRGGEKKERRALEMKEGMGDRCKSEEKKQERH